MPSAIWQVLLQLSPWLLLGAVVASVLHGVLPAGLIKRQFRGRAGVVKAVAFGIPLPLCSCGVIPAALGLKKDGASDGASIGFMISTPQTGIDSIMVSASFLGWPFALFKVVSATVMGLVGGFLTEGKGAPASDGDNDGEKKEQQQPAASAGRVREIFFFNDTATTEIYTWLLVGVVVSAAIQVYVPSAFWTGLSAYGGAFTMAAVLGVSLPLYVCATASVPIAAALVAGGLPHGAALVFLMAGPASNVATIGAVVKGFGRRALAIYLLTIVSGSLAAGLLFDSLLPSGQVAVHDMSEHQSWWAVASTAVLLAMMLYFVVSDARQWWRARSASSAAATHILGIDGMTCGGCVRKVESALSELPDIESVTVQLEPGQAQITGRVTIDRVHEVVRACGYQTREITRS
jgi:uncharacterized membrane protein YraQ (UPF0718 family)/copper chaperone CopZ